jgi:hypothetical protein
MSKRELSISDQHQLKIARDTLKLSRVGAMLLGGPNHEQAIKIIERLTGKRVPMPEDI